MNWVGFMTQMGEPEVSWTECLALKEKQVRHLKYRR